MNHLIGVYDKEMPDRVHLAEDTNRIAHLLDGEGETGEGEPEHAENHHDGYRVAQYRKDADDENAYALTGNYIQNGSHQHSEDAALGGMIKKSVKDDAAYKSPNNKNSRVGE